MVVTQRTWDAGVPNRMMPSGRAQAQSPAVAGRPGSPPREWVTVIAWSLRYAELGF